jgi:hypothetical protein
MSRCRWHTDEKTGEKYHVPGCWGGLMHPENCYCRRSSAGRATYDAQEDDDEIDKLVQRVADLEKLVSELQTPPLCKPEK